jgi:hypothetical protein
MTRYKICTSNATPYVTQKTAGPMIARTMMHVENLEFNIPDATKTGWSVLVGEPGKTLDHTGNCCDAQ